MFLAAVAAHAQTVTLRACNPGKTEVDVYFAQGGNVVAQHVAPSYCANLASSQGAMAPGLVAVGFADIQANGAECTASSESRISAPAWRRAPRKRSR